AGSPLDKRRRWAAGTSGVDSARPKNTPAGDLPGCPWRRSTPGRQRLRIEGRALALRAWPSEAVTAIDVTTESSARRRWLDVTNLSPRRISASEADTPLGNRSRD